LGTLKSTSSYPTRQAINECGGICYPGSVPNGTTLSSCTITFTGSRAGVWYAIALQVCRLLFLHKRFLVYLSLRLHNSLQHTIDTSNYPFSILLKLYEKFSKPSTRPRNRAIFCASARPGPTLVINVSLTKIFTV
jgi:hypothetical protein